MHLAAYVRHIYIVYTPTAMYLRIKLMIYSLDVHLWIKHSFGYFCYQTTSYSQIIVIESDFTNFVYF